VLILWIESGHAWQAVSIPYPVIKRWHADATSWNPEAEGGTDGSRHCAQNSEKMVHSATAIWHWV
jgi:hypothetical protein